MFQIKVLEKIKTNLLCLITASENCVVYKKMLKKVEEPDTPQMTISRMRSAYCIPKATDTHSEYEIRYGTMFQTENSLRFITKTLSSGEYPSQTSLLLHL